MLANVHLYIYDEGALEARVETVQLEVLSLTDLSNLAYEMQTHYGAAHVNFELA